MRPVRTRKEAKYYFDYILSFSPVLHDILLVYVYEGDEVFGRGSGSCG